MYSFVKFKSWVKVVFSEKGNYYYGNFNTKSTKYLLISFLLSTD